MKNGRSTKLAKLRCLFCAAKKILMADSRSALMVLVIEPLEAEPGPDGCINVRSWMSEHGPSCAIRGGYLKALERYPS